MPYPDTTLKDDTLDPLYGGRPATEWGALAWQWINNVVRFLGQAHLDYNRVPFRSIAATVYSGSLAAGDVAVVDLGTSTAAGALLVRKARTDDLTNPLVRVLGVTVSGAGVNARARIAVGGLLPRTYTGFATLPGGAPLAVNYTAGRLKVAATGEAVIAYGDVQGNALLRLGA